MSQTAHRHPTVERSYVGPAFKDARVHDAMRVGVVTCRPETSLTDVARMMVGYSMHSVVVSDLARPGRAWGIVTSLDLARAAEDLAARTAGEVASVDPITVDSDATLDRAARLMAEHGISHLVVVQPRTDVPVGMISAGTIAEALAYGRP
jgi:arabinose-5-phosphate isomerase